MRGSFGRLAGAWLLDAAAGVVGAVAGFSLGAARLSELHYMVSAHAKTGAARKAGRRTSALKTAGWIRAAGDSTARRGGIGGVGGIRLRVLAPALDQTHAFQ